MGHVDKDSDGDTDISIPGGKLLKEKAKPVAMFSMVLQTTVEFRDNASNYYFMTQNTGKNVTKSPEEMFSTFLIPNNLQFVLDQMNKYEN